MCTSVSFHDPKNQSSPLEISTIGELKHFLQCNDLLLDNGLIASNETDNSCLCGVDIVKSVQESPLNLVAFKDENGDLSFSGGDYVITTPSVCVEALTSLYQKNKTNDILLWMATKNTGISSKTMAFVALGVDYYDADCPYDISDFGRCYDLVQSVPDIVSIIKQIEVEKITYKPIMAFVHAWHNLSALYEKYLSEGKDRQSDNAQFLSSVIHELRYAGNDVNKVKEAFEKAKANVEAKKTKKELEEATKKAAEEKAKAEYDALPAIKKRPKLDDSVIRMGAQIFVEEHFKNGDNWLEGCVDDFIEEIITEWNHDDGFEIGQKLNSNGWDLGRNEFEDLDYLSSCIEQAHKKLVKQWIEDNQITPPYPIGTHVKFDHTKKGLTGVIKEDGVGSRHYIGQYVIEVDAIHDYGKGCPIVNWEDVEPTALYSLESSDSLKQMVVSALQDESIELRIKSHEH